MHREKLYSALLARVNEYKHNHIQTVEIDLRIAEASFSTFCASSSPFNSESFRSFFQIDSFPRLYPVMVIHLKSFAGCCITQFFFKHRFDHVFLEFTCIPFVRYSRGHKNHSPPVIQYTILNNKWGAVHSSLRRRLYLFFSSTGRMRPVKWGFPVPRQNLRFYRRQSQSDFEIQRISNLGDSVP